MEDVSERTDEPSAEDVADFEAGFSGVRGEEPPAQAEPEQVAADSDTQPDASSVEPSAQQAEEAADEMVPGLGMPASQVRQLLAKAAAYDDLKAEIEAREAKVFGKFGDVQRHLNQIKDLQEQITALKESGNRAGSIKLSAQKDKLLARVRAEYPELGELLAEDIAELSGDQSAATELPDVTGIVDQRMQQVNERIEIMRLESMHPDWQEISATPEFALWKSGLAPETKHKLETSNDGSYVARGLTAFKEWREQTHGKAKSSQKRLESAITPSGIPSTSVPAKTPEQEFEDGYTSIRSRRL